MNLKLKAANGSNQMRLNTLKKSIKLFLLFGTVVLVGPFILAKTGFYTTSYAKKPNNPEIQKTGLFGSSKSDSSNTAQSGPVSYAASVKKAAPAVVSIQTKTKVPEQQAPHPFAPWFQGPGPFGGPFPGGPPGHSPFGPGPGGPGGRQPEFQQGLGSGVIIDKSGIILTNFHVIENADSVKVKLADDREAEAKVIGTDPETDLAILKIDLKDLPIIPIGSSGKLQVGDIVLAIGNPFNVGQTVTFGIISATDRSGLGTLHDNFLQTDAAINPGNSGGALVDATGNLVGINTAILSRSGGYNGVFARGIGFAIPIDSALNIVNQLTTSGRVTRGFLGVILAPLSDQIKQYTKYDKKEGVFIQAVQRGTPAAKAGVLPGDILVSINKKEIKNPREARKRVASLKPNVPYEITVFRKGDYLDFSVMLVDREEIKKQDN